MTKNQRMATKNQKKKIKLEVAEQSDKMAADILADRPDAVPRKRRSTYITHTLYRRIKT